MQRRPSQLARLLRSVSTRSPQGLKAALRPLVRRVVPPSLRRDVHETPVREADITAADRWIDNHYTIEADGRKRHFFFVCGCFKSGTNWVQNLLNLHPHAQVQGEFHFEVLRNAVDQLTGVYWFLGSDPALREVGIDASEAMIRRMIFAATRSKPGAVWLGDRTPNPLRTIIRGAPQIFITRDVRDVLVSWSFHHLRVDNERGIAVPFREKWRTASQRFRADPAGFNPLDGLLGDEAWVRHHARHWADVARKSRLALPQLRAEGAPVLELRYEQLHADLDREIDRLYEFLSLDRSLAQAPSTRTKTLPGFGREDRTSFLRKGAVGDWRSHLDERLCRIIEEEAGEEMSIAGYPSDTSPHIEAPAPALRSAPETV